MLKSNQMGNRENPQFSRTGERAKKMEFGFSTASTETQRRRRKEGVRPYRR